MSYAVYADNNGILKAIALRSEWRAKDIDREVASLTGRERSNWYGVIDPSVMNENSAVQRALEEGCTIKSLS